MVIQRLLSIEEQKAYERQRIEEAKGSVKSLDTHSPPMVDRVCAPQDLAGDLVAGSDIVDTTKYKYDRIKVRGPDGVARYTAGNRDAIAKSMLGMTKKQVFDVSKENNLKMDVHFKSRNDGHFRMIVGQALRSIIAKGNTITIDGVEIKSLDQKVEWPKGYVQEDKGTSTEPVRRGAPSIARIKP